MPLAYSLLMVQLNETMILSQKIRHLNAIDDNEKYSRLVNMIAQKLNQGSGIILCHIVILLTSNL